jgi:hypothetical protein
LSWILLHPQLITVVGHRGPAPDNPSDSDQQGRLLNRGVMRVTEKRQSPRILHVAKACFPDVGGIETVVRQLAEGAFKQGYEVSVLCCGEKTVVEEFAGVTVYRYKPFFNVGSAPLSFHFMLKLWQLLKRHDIVH